MKQLSGLMLQPGLFSPDRVRIQIDNQAWIQKLLMALMFFDCKGNSYMFRLLSALIIGVSFISLPSAAQNISTAAYVEKPPVIDGKISDGEWSQCSAITGFVDSFKESGRFTDEQMTVHLAYDKTHFYLGFTILLGEGQLQKPKAVKRDGKVWTDDCVEIFFQPSAKTKPEQIFHFIGNSKGVIYDEKNGDKTWDGKWNYSASVADKTWFGELSISFSEFGAGFPENNSTWGMNINCDLMSLKTGRHWARVGESITNWEKFGKVVFGTEAPAVQLLELGKLEQGKLNLNADICSNLNSNTDELQAALLVDGKVQKSWILKTKAGGKEKISFEKTIAGKGDRLLEFIVSSSDKKILHKSSVPFLIRNRMNVVASYYSLYKELEVRLDVSGFTGTKDGLSAVVSAVEAGSKKVIQEKEINSFEKTKAMATLDVSSFKEGQYEIKTSLQQNGKVLEESKEKFIYMNAVIPGKTILSATQLSLAIDWFIEGDDNENCRVSVAYREKGEGSWKTALDLLRIENMVNDGRGTNDLAIKEGSRNRRYWTFDPPVAFGNLLSGSIFYLKPDTTYDILLKLADPDGGTAQRVLTARTRKIPRASTKGKTLHVAPGGAAGDGTAAKPFG
ncbi:MAG: sugar-binding protein, partial [Planctomycetota bacterium]